MIFQRRQKSLLGSKGLKRKSRLQQTTILQLSKFSNDIS